MHIKYLILPTFLLASCGNQNQSTPSSAPVEPVKTAPVVQKAATLTPMQRGEKLYKRCLTCHTLAEDGKDKVGPNLWGVYNRKAGSREGFNYSKAMLASDITWTQDNLDAYIAKPATFIKGNRMSFVGIKKAEDRTALLLYLKANTGGDQ